MPASPMITLTRNWNLTGRVQMRVVATSWWFQSTAVKLMVEQSYEIATTQYQRPDDSYDYRTVTTWREMTADDMHHPKLRWIVDGPPRAGVQ